jgi:hypothetical protein
MPPDFGNVRVSGRPQPLIRLTFFCSANGGQKMCEYDSRARGEVNPDTGGATSSPRLSKLSTYLQASSWPDA